MPRAAVALNVIPLPNAAPSQLMSDLAWWSDTLRAKNRSGATIESYRLTLATFDRFLDDHGYPRSTDEITRQHVQAFITDQLGKHSAQRTEAARLRASDPVGDSATETRRLREQMEANALAEQYPSRAQARNILLPEAWRLLGAGNLDGAQKYLAAARKVGADDGNLDREINRLLDASVPHRRQAVELEVMAQDELELSRRDIAASRVAHKIGTPVEQIRASNVVKMADYQRQREAPVIAQELGIELPTATD